MVPYFSTNANAGTDKVDIFIARNFKNFQGLRAAPPLSVNYLIHDSGTGFREDVQVMISATNISSEDFQIDGETHPLRISI